MRVRFSLPAPKKFDFLRCCNFAAADLLEQQPIKFCSNCGAETTRDVPSGDSLTRDTCQKCHTIHYVNPKNVVGCIPVFEGKILLCKRAIEPRKGFWTLPAGFMELGETMAEGAARETWEEALARVEVGHLFAAVDIVQAGQVHVFFTATFDGQFGAGAESLEVALYEPENIPWDQLAFASGKFALQKFIAHDSDSKETYLHSAAKIQSGQKS